MIQYGILLKCNSSVSTTSYYYCTMVKSQLSFPTVRTADIVVRPGRLNAHRRIVYRAIIVSSRRRRLSKTISDKFDFGRFSIFKFYFQSFTELFPPPPPEYFDCLTAISVYHHEHASIFEFRFPGTRIRYLVKTYANMIR